MDTTLSDILSYLLFLASVGFVGFIISKRGDILWEAIIGEDGHLSVIEIAAMLWFICFMTAFYADLFFDRQMSEAMSEAVNTIYITTIIGVVGEKFVKK